METLPDARHPTQLPDLAPAAWPAHWGWLQFGRSAKADAAPRRWRKRSARWSARRKIQKGKVKLDLPPLVENGNAVSMTVSVDSPMTPADHVKAIHVFTEKNPQPNVVSVRLGARAGRAEHRDPHPARRYAGMHRHRRNERRLVLVRSRLCGGDARRLPGGPVMARALINVPKEAKRGEIIEIKTLVSHVMETGYRRSNVGAAIPRDIINSFVCTYNGEEIFRAELFPAISANPFITFHTVATESGTHRIQVDRRPGQRHDQVGFHHRRMTVSRGHPPALRNLQSRCCCHRRRDSARRAALRLRVHGPRYARHAG